MLEKATYFRMISIYLKYLKSFKNKFQKCPSTKNKVDLSECSQGFMVRLQFKRV